MITIKQKGNFRKTEAYLSWLERMEYFFILHKYGKIGVKALSDATPKDSGETADSWDFKVTIGDDISKIVFTNSKIVDGYPIAILLQYGHGTGQGGWVEGRDYINPAIQPVFDELTNSLWREVTK